MKIAVVVLRASMVVWILGCYINLRVAASVGTSRNATLPCGGTQLLTPHNATDATFVLSFCSDTENGTTVRLHGDGASDITNLTLLVQHSVHVRVAVDNVRLVNSTISLLNVSFPEVSQCHSCTGGGAAFHVRNAAVENSALLLRDCQVDLDDLAIVAVEKTSLVFSEILIDEFLTRVNVRSISISVVQSSLIASNVTLWNSVVESQDNAAVLLLQNTTVTRSRVLTLNCTFLTTSIAHGVLSSALLADGCVWKDSEWRISNVSIRLLAETNTISLQRLLVVIVWSTAVSLHLVVTDVRSSNASMIEVRDSVVSHSSIILESYTVQASLPTLPCSVALERSTVSLTDVVQSNGVVATASRTKAELFCVSQCSVVLSRFSCTRLALSQNLTLPGDSSNNVTGPSAGGESGVVGVYRSSMQQTSLSVAEVVVTVAVPLMVSLFVTASHMLDCNLTLSSSSVSAVGGVVLSQCEMLQSVVMLTSSTIFASNAAFWIRLSRLRSTVVVVRGCSIHVTTIDAWYVSQSNLSAVDIFVEDTALSAWSDVFGFARALCNDTTKVLVLGCSMSATTSTALYVLLSAMSTFVSVEIEGTTLRAESNGLQVQDSELRDVNLTLSDCTIIVSGSSALRFSDAILERCSFVVASSVIDSTTSSFVFQFSSATTSSVILNRCDVTAIQNGFLIAATTFDNNSWIAIYDSRISAYTTALSLQQRSQLSRSALIVHDCSVVGLISGAVLVSSVAFIRAAFEFVRVHVSSASVALTLQKQSLLSNSNITFFDCDIIATTSNAWLLKDAAMFESHVVLQRTNITAPYHSLIIENSSAIATSLRLVDCVVVSSAQFAWVTTNTTWDKSSIDVLRSSVFSDRNSVRFKNCNFTTGSAFSVVDCDVSAAQVPAWLMIQVHLLGADVMLFFLRSSLSAASSGFVLQESVVHASRVAFVDCDVSVQRSDAWLAFGSTFLAASGILVERTVLRAGVATAFGLYNCNFFSSRVVVVNSNASVNLSRNALLVFGSTFAQRSELVVNGSNCSATTNTVHFSATVIGASITFAKCNIIAWASVAFVGHSSIFSSAVFLFEDTSIRSSENTAVTFQSAEVASTFITLIRCNFSATLSGAWFVFLVNMIDVTLFIEETSLLSGRTAFAFSQTNISQTEIALLRCNITTTTLSVVNFTKVSLADVSVELRSSQLNGRSGVFLSSCSLVHSNIALVGCRVRVSASPHLLIQDTVISNCTLRVENAVFLWHDRCPGSASCIEHWNHTEPAVIVCSTVAVNDSTVALVDVINQQQSHVVLCNISSSVFHGGALTLANVSSTSLASGGLLHVSGSAMRLQVLHMAYCQLVLGDTLVTFLNSTVDLAVFSLVRLLLSNTHGTAATAVVAAKGATKLSFSNVSVDVSRVAGFVAVFHVSSASTLQCRTAAFRCSSWSFSSSIIKYRPITKLQLGAGFFNRTSFFALQGGSDIDRECDAVTSSVSMSATLSAVVLSATRTVIDTVSHSADTTASAVLSLTVTRSALQFSATPSPNSSITMTHDVTPTIVVVFRRQLTTGNTGVDFAALVGAGIAASAFAAVQSGLVAQRIAFSIRTATMNCGAYDAVHGGGGSDDAGVDWLSSPTQMSIGIPPGAAHRGAVVGNAVVCSAALVAAFLVVVCAARVTKVQMAAGYLSRWHLVSIPVAVLLQPTFTLSIALIGFATSRSEQRAVNVGIGILGGLVVASVLFLLVYVLDPRTSRFRARLQSVSSAPQTGAAIDWYRRWAAASTAWRPKPGHPAFVKDWGFLFDEARANRHWWLLVDVCVSLVVGGLAAVEPGSSGSCVALKWAIVAATCAAVVLPLVLRPLNSHRATCSCVTLASLTALIAVLGVAEADPAVIEGISILAVVLQWLPILLQAIVARLSVAKMPMTLSADSFDNTHSRDLFSHGVSCEIQRVRYCKRRQPLLPSRLDRQSALRAVVMLICSERHRQRLELRPSEIA